MVIHRDPELQRFSRGAPGADHPPIAAYVLLTPAAAVLAFLAFRGLYEIAASEYSQPSILSIIAVPALALAIGATFFWFRDKMKSPYYAVIEVGVGMATAAQFVMPERGNGLVRVMAFLAGTRIIVDGIHRFLRFSGLWKPVE
jgi:hypothetical protein